MNTLQFLLMDKNDDIYANTLVLSKIAQFVFI